MSPISKMEEQSFLLVNSYRNQKGKPAMVLSNTITEIARTHSQNMANLHNRNPSSLQISHDGAKERFDKLIATRKISSVAENVAANYNAKEPLLTAVTGWIKSPGHQKNMVGDYSHSGLGIAKAYDGTYFFTQLFAKVTS